MIELHVEPAEPHVGDAGRNKYIVVATYPTGERSPVIPTEGPAARRFAGHSLPEARAEVFNICRALNEHYVEGRHPFPYVVSASMVRAPAALAIGCAVDIALSAGGLRPETVEMPALQAAH